MRERKWKVSSDTAKSLETFYPSLLPQQCFAEAEKRRRSNRPLEAILYAEVAANLGQQTDACVLSIAAIQATASELKEIASDIMSNPDEVARSVIKEYVNGVLSTNLERIQEKKTARCGFVSSC